MSKIHEKVESAGPFLRDIVFGVHDALLTNIGVIAGFVTAFQVNRLVIIAALIDVFISAFAMAFGTYLSRTSESEYLEGQLHEKTQADLEEVMANPIASGVVMWFTYVISGTIPLIPFFVGLPIYAAVKYSLILAFIIFFIVGAFKGILTKGSALKSGMQFVLFGSVAAVVGYFIGVYGQHFIAGH